MFRKVIALVMVFLLTVSFGTSTFAAESTERNKEEALTLIEKTNRSIEKKISEAVEKADELTEKFLKDLRIIEEGKEVVQLQEKRAQLEAALKDADSKEVIKIQEQLVKVDSSLATETGKIDKKISEINLDIEELNASLEFGKDPEKITKKITGLQNKLDERSELYVKRTEKYSKELDKLILELYNETLKMSQDTIRRAAEKGVSAECSWILVKFGNKWAWIDPIRVQW